MLKHLRIRNFAIVEDIELEFDGGMTVLTGETGAGKSILLDALGLTLGDRADSSVVRHGSDRADISATFLVDTLPAVARWLEEQELEADGECIVRRTVSAEGRSRAYLNGQPVPVQQIKELGDFLVDIHGQHGHQSLLRREVQRELLDGFAGHGEHVAEVADHYRGWRRLQDDRERLERAARERESRLDLLRYQVRELEALDLREGELSELEEEHGRLANATRLLEGAQVAAQMLYEGDEFNASALLDRTQTELGGLRDYDPALGPVCELIESASIQVAEAASSLRHYLADLDLDPERLNQVEQRLADIQDLARKHRCEAEELPALLRRLREELSELEEAETRLSGLDEAIAKAREAYAKSAGRLSEGRAEAAKRLAGAVTEAMQSLGMAGGRFEVALDADPAGEPQLHGAEQVELLVSANPGQPLRPLARVASGGELSRISLSIQVIAAGQAGVPTLIFDEVDVGVGGGVAEMVGRHLRSLGDSRQVLCVTHQPQVAAQGHHHVRIAKEKGPDHTRTLVERLPDKERVEEVARMLGGMDITAQTRSHAKEMLKLARKSREA